MVAGHTNGQNLTDVSLSTELFLYLGTVWAQIYMYKINVGESFIPIESGSACFCKKMYNFNMWTQN